jgi:hypothetical protein
MYLTVYSPGTAITTGDYRASFKVNSDSPPPAFTADVSFTIAGKTLTFHKSEYDSVSKSYDLYFSLAENPLEVQALVIGLMMLLGVTTDNVSITSIAKSIEIPAFLWVLVAIGLYFLYVKVIK